MFRHAVVYSDTESGGEEDSELVELEEDARVNRLRPLVEAYEFAIRNVLLGGDYLAAASAQHKRLQSLSNVLFEEAVSSRWSPAFLAVLKRARALRICTHVFVSPHDELHTEGRCLACGAKEQSSTDTLELIADDGGVNACALSHLSQRFDVLEACDFAWRGEDWDSHYCGMYAGGAKCLDRAAAAVLARNLVLDTCLDLSGNLAEVLNDETLVAQLERDERTPNPQIEPLTDCVDAARRLVTRIRTIEDVLRGKPYPVDPELQRTGTDATWDRVDAYKARRGDVLRFAGARACALVRGDVEPPLPPSSPSRRPPRGAAGVSTRSRARSAAPVASRTRRRSR